ncbi:hypothetical protein HY483_00310 [Candidatus Woesearchaeota archaeon]|nr:hypothetical protein [Candidatus Woesearchaeota archaeon]
MTTEWELTKEEKKVIDAIPEEELADNRTAEEIVNQKKKGQTPSGMMIEKVLMYGIDTAAHTHFFQRAFERERRGMESIDTFIQRFNIHFTTGKIEDYDGYHRQGNEHIKLIMYDPFRIPLRSIEQDGVYIPKGAYYKRSRGEFPVVKKGIRTWIESGGGENRQVFLFHDSVNTAGCLWDFTLSEALDIPYTRTSQDIINATFLGERVWTPQDLNDQELLLRAIHCSRALWKGRLKEYEAYFKREDATEQEKAVRKLIDYYEHLPEIMKLKKKEESNAYECQGHFDIEC